MSSVAARFETWGFDAPPRQAHARSGRVVEAVAQAVEVRRESPHARTQLALVAPVASQAVRRAAPTPMQACAAYRAMSSLAPGGLGRLIDDEA
ncbi:MAG TPA: hypothetical protein VIS77_04615 [Burkholderiales bacterium]